MDSMFNDFFNDSFFGFAGVNPIKADIKETEKEFIIEAEIPGAKKEDIKLDLRDDRLTISVETNEETKEERDNYIRKERRFGSCSRSFYVENVKNEDVAAKYENGILSVVLPKSETKRTNNRIEIQ
jgi:HSP20 family protein